jgi:hypothetical protein
MKHPVYLPPFLNGIDLDGTALSFLKDEDWLTDNLKEEISSHFPNSNGIGNDRARSKVSFESHAEVLFPKDRIFASFVQLCVSVDTFLKAWGASSSHGSSHLTCFFGKPSRKPHTSVVKPDKQRVWTPSLKKRNYVLFLRSFTLSRKRRKDPRRKTIFRHINVSIYHAMHAMTLPSCILAPA